MHEYESTVYAIGKASGQQYALVKFGMRQSHTQISDHRGNWCP